MGDGRWEMGDGRHLDVCAVPFARRQLGMLQRTDSQIPGGKISGISCLPFLVGCDSSLDAVEPQTSGLSAW